MAVLLDVDSAASWAVYSADPRVFLWVDSKVVYWAGPSVVLWVDLKAVPWELCSVGQSAARMAGDSVGPRG